MSDTDGEAKRPRSSASAPAKAAASWLVLGALSFILVVFNPLATAAVHFNQESAVGGTAIYGTLRVMSSVMSVAEDADIQGSVAVASATFSPGQLLEPVTNTIDRIADLLFILIIGSGLVAALTTPIAQIGAAVAFVAAASIGAARLLRFLRNPYADSLLRSLFLLGFLAAAVIPGAFAGAAVLGDSLTRGAWQNATEVFRGMETQIDAGASENSLAASEALTSANEPEASQPEPVAPGEGMIGGAFSKIGSAWTESKTAISDTARAAAGLASSVRDQAASNVRIIRNGVAFSGHLLEASVQIAVAYLAKLVVLPMMIFGAAIFVLRSAMRPSFRYGAPPIRSEQGV